MNSLRDAFRRTSLHRYFAGLEPIDRLTFFAATAAALVAGISFSMIVYR